MSSHELSEAAKVGLYSKQLGIDPIVHAPARLIIVLILHAAAKECDFRCLLELTELSAGNLSAQTTKLEQAGYISITKRFLGRYPNSLYRLTPEGSAALETYCIVYCPLHPRLTQVSPHWPLGLGSRYVFCFLAWNMPMEERLVVVVRMVVTT